LIINGASKLTALD